MDQLGIVGGFPVVKCRLASVSFSGRVSLRGKGRLAKYSFDARGAFTLIELLVVIAIVGILVTISWSVLQNSKRSADQAHSISNLRQIGTAAILFASDHNGLLPMGYFYLPGQGETTYAIQLAPYVGGNSSTEGANHNASVNIFVAPTSALRPVAPNSGGFIGMTYSANNLVCPDTTTGGTQIRLNRITRPGQVILVADGCQSPTSTYSRSSFTQPTISANTMLDLTHPIPVGPDADTTAGAGYLRYRNSGAVAAVMVDGHAQMMQKGTVLYSNIVPR